MGVHGYIHILGAIGVLVILRPKSSGPTGPRWIPNGLARGPIGSIWAHGGPMGPWAHGPTGPHGPKGAVWDPTGAELELSGK
jgi:hypothetical protein